MNRLADQDYEQFKQMFMNLTGIDLSLYKEEQMKRRLNTLRLKRQIPTFVSYYLQMKKSDELLQECLNRITINVTEFFRNRQRWDVLEGKLIRSFLQKKHVSVWSAACSTGEEAYSLAILLSKHFSPDRFSIVATDVDRTVLQKAAEGKYVTGALKSVTAQERRQYFLREGLFYRIDERLKRSIRFMRHDLLAEPSPGLFDLVVCRNVLIYFTNEGKNRIYQKLSDALKTNGILFVGSTEQIFQPKTYHLKAAETFFYEKIEG
ncbi:protein-glutamate O-methyltransferase CheR [Sporolactobacillus sp. THM7-7]|nr:protein-glutamate O-methyltransferase CheR [Sporolactobacillus sp. THM7-7]